MKSYQMNSGSGNKRSQARIEEMIRKKGSWQAVIEDEEEIYSAIVTMGIPQNFHSYATGGLGSFAKYNFNENLEIGVSLGRVEIDTFSNDYEMDEEQTEQLKSLYPEIHDRTYRAMGIDERTSIATAWGTYETETDISQRKIHFHLSEPIGGGGGLGGRQFSDSSETLKSLIPSHSTLDRASDYLQPRTKALERNNDSSVLFVLPSQSFGGAGE